MSHHTEPADVAVIGAGFAGTMVAAHLLTRARAPLSIKMFERDPSHFGRGVAYSSTADCHLLNVPAGNMSAFPDQPEHFLRWAQSRESLLLNPPWVTEVGPNSFLPRRAYGDYLNWILNEAESAAPSGVCLERRMEKVSGLAITAEGGHLQLANSETVHVKRVVLAVGNFPPGNPRIAEPDFYDSARYFRNPWLPGVLSRLLDTDSCLLIGSGLTMVDWAVTLGHLGYKGKIHVVSRRGFWPKTHRLQPPAAFAIEAGGQPRVTEWVKQIRAHIALSGADWRTVIDALRPNNQKLWQSLSLAEQRRFMRHVRPFWDLHRHRLAPQVAQQLENLLASEQLCRHVGLVQAYRELDQGVEATIRKRHSGETETIRIDAVVNCSGSESDYRRLESALIRDLLRQGLIRPDPLSLGLETSSDGALIGSDGATSDCLYTLGPPRKGMLWETTAVPELRTQAQHLAELLLRGEGRA